MTAGGELVSPSPESAVICASLLLPRPRGRNSRKPVRRSSAENHRTVMSAKGVGASVARKEDDRFLRGRGQYVADFRFPGIRDVAFVRSTIAHGRIRAIHVPPGFEGAVFTAPIWSASSRSARRRRCAASSIPPSRSWRRTRCGMWARSSPCASAARAPRPRTSPRR